MNIDFHSCPQCQQALPPQADGLCPTCVLRAMNELAPEDETEGWLHFKEIRYLGKYELLGEIARGGMGIVYRARQIPLNRTVAVKVIVNGAFASPEMIRRFRMEAEVAANLHHPNIVSIHEIGEHEAFPYYSMALIEGKTLAEHVREKPMALEETARLLIAVSSAVQFAHERGVLHRDLKPNNILIDAEGKPHLTDFGLAKVLKAEEGVTRSLSILGTPAFMAPEQAAGASAPLTTAADVYALGAILFYSLTGKCVFQAESTLAVIQQVLHQPAPAPSVLNRAIDRDLEIVCLKCLQKNPSDRYPSALALAQDLERWLAGKPIEARPRTAVENLVKLVQRKPLPSALAAMLALTFLAGAGLIFKEWRRANAALVKAHEQTLATQKQKNIAEARLYAGDMMLAGTAIAQNNFRRAQGLLDAYLPENRQVDRRGFEWRYHSLRARSADFMCFEGPFGNVRGLAFSASGQYLASVGDGNCRARLWDVKGRKMVTSLRHPGGGFYEDITFSPDSANIALAGPSIELRTIPDLRLVWSQPGQGGYLKPRFSPDGKWLVAGLNGNCKVFSAADGKLAATLPGSGNAPAFSPDGKSLYGTGQSSFTEWDTSDWSLKRSGTNNAHIYCAALSHDGRFVALGGNFANIRVIRLSDFQDERSFPAPGTPCYDVAFSPDDSIVYSAHAGNVAIKWDWKSGKVIDLVRGHRASVSSLALSPDGKTLATGSVNEIFLLNVEELNESNFTARIIGSWSTEPTASPDGNLFALLTPTGVEIRRFSDPGKIISRLPKEVTPGEPITVPMNFSDDSHLICLDVPNDPNNVPPIRMTEFNFRSGEIRSTITDLPTRVFYANSSPRADWISVSSETNLSIMHRPSAKIVANITTKMQIRSHAFSPDSDLFVVMEDEGISFWNPADWTLVRRKHLSGSGAGDIAFCHSRRLFATGSIDGVSRLWNFSGEQVAEIPGNNVSIFSISFSPDDRTFVTGTINGLAVFFNVETLREVGNMERAWKIGFTPQGNLYAVDALEMKTRIVRLPTFQEFAEKRRSGIRVME